MWNFLRNHPIAGSALYVGPFVTILGFVMDGLHMVEILPPAILEGIGATIFFLAMIGILNKWYNEAIAPTKAHAATARRLFVTERAASASFFRTILISFLLLGIFAGILLMYALSRYLDYQDAIENSRLEIFNSSIVPPGTPRVPNAPPGLSVNIFAIPRGPYVSAGMVHNTLLKYPDKPYGREETDQIFKVLDAGIPDPVKGGIEIYPGLEHGQWFTENDPRFSTEDWTAMLSGNKFVYVFVEMKYAVRSSIRVTEYCMLVTKDFPAIHFCSIHNRIFTLR